MATIRPMDIRTIRRNNFESLIGEAGTIAELSRRTDTNEKYLRQIFNGFKGNDRKNPRQVGDELARKLETGMGKSPGWMDQLNTATAAPRLVMQNAPAYDIPRQSTAMASPATQLAPHIQAIADALAGTKPTDLLVQSIMMLIAGAPPVVANNDAPAADATRRKFNTHDVARKKATADSK